MLTWPTKDPNEVLDYQIDWDDEDPPGPRLVDGETISTSTFSIVSGDVVIAVSPAPSVADGVTTVWLTGGTADTSAVILNRVVTSAGRTYDKSVKLRIRSQ